MGIHHRHLEDAMSRKRPGWRAAERTYKYLTDQLREAAEQDAALMEDIQGFPPDSEVQTARPVPWTARPLPCARCHQRIATFVADFQGFEVICRQCITLDDRWFCGKYPCGLVYADRATEEHGDYKRVAFLPYSSLVLDVDDPASPLIERVKADAAAMQARRGQPYQIAGNMTITLGELHG
jgi:hypothetical protein